ncbi:hypothetical protein, partial [Rhizobium sp. LjRoot98]|uniref:hypothetical protein n=1 Tax=Rhizobium sp. LjRoot98 TaxID=3342345 RepID=UPI003F50525C
SSASPRMKSTIRSRLTVVGGKVVYDRVSGSPALAQQGSMVIGDCATTRHGRLTWLYPRSNQPIEDRPD